MPAWRAFTLACTLLLLGAVAAQACPSGTVFSPFGGSCLYKGMGKAQAVKCAVRGEGKCPSDTKSRKGEYDNFCCPTVATDSRPPICRIDGTAPFCAGACNAGLGEIQKGYFGYKTMGCVTGRKVRCCR